MTERTGRTYIALGANLPFAGLSGPALLESALDSMAAAKVKVLKRSSFWQSPPFHPEFKHEPPYVNAVVEADPGALGPAELFAVLTKIEAAHGRERRIRWAERTLDLDILDYKGLVGTFGDIELPHPRLAERAFVLEPLAEIAPDWRHPQTGKSVSEYLAALGKQEITRLP